MSYTTLIDEEDCYPKNPFANELCKFLRKLCRRFGKKQKDIAKCLNISQGSLSRFMSSSVYCHTLIINTQGYVKENDHLLGVNCLQLRDLLKNLEKIELKRIRNYKSPNKSITFNTTDDDDDDDDHTNKVEGEQSHKDNDEHVTKYWEVDEDKQKFIITSKTSKVKDRKLLSTAINATNSTNTTTTTIISTNTSVFIKEYSIDDLIKEIYLKNEQNSSLKESNEGNLTKQILYEKLYESLKTYFNK